MQSGRQAGRQADRQAGTVPVQYYKNEIKSPGVMHTVQGEGIRTYVVHVPVVRTGIDAVVTLISRKFGQARTCMHTPVSYMLDL